MKHQVLFSLKTMKTYSRLSSAAAVIGALRINLLLWFTVIVIVEFLVVLDLLYIILDSLATIWPRG